MMDLLESVGLGDPTTLAIAGAVFALIAYLFLFTRAAAKVDDSAPVYPESMMSDYTKVDENEYCTTDGKKCLPTRFAEEGIGSEAECPELTMHEFFQKAVDAKRNKVALRVERLDDNGKPDRYGSAPALVNKKAPPALPADQWTQWTYGEYNEECRAAAKGFMSLGLEQHDAVSIYGFNAPEWLMSEIGAIFAGGKAAGIYPTDTPDQVAFKVNHSGAAIACVDDAQKLEKFAALVQHPDGNQIPHLKAIVAWAAEPTRQQSMVFKKNGITCMGWDALLTRGKEIPDEELEGRQAEILPGHCCALIYTSGTTGNPKAVMISHDNIIFEARCAMTIIPHVGAKAEQERIISFLPLSHVAGMMVDIIMPICISARKSAWLTSYFARPYDLKLGSIGDRLRIVRPTVFLGVPRVWEKVAEKLKAVGSQTKGAKLKLVRWAKGKGLQHQENKQLGGSGSYPFLYGLADKLVLSTVKKKLGLDACKFGFTGAAPITTDTLEFFGALGIQINEVYGMSECTGATTFSTDACHVWGSCGFAMPGCEVAILRETADGQFEDCPRSKDIFNATEEEQGEICFRGRHIMMGYMAQPRLGKPHMAEIDGKLKSAIDRDGWLHSGDKGCMGENGFVKITGRYKELIIGAGGENIAPVPIEDNLKSVCPAISNIMMVGDKRKFNVAVVTLKAVGATGELPGTDELLPDAADCCSAGCTTISGAMDDATLIKCLTDAFAKTNGDPKVCPNNASKIQRFTILPEDFSVSTDELTPTLKLKRGFVDKKLKPLIDHVYAQKSRDAYVRYKAF